MNRPRVLYIDDEHEILDLAVCFFEDEGIDIVTCGSCQDAIKLVRENHFDMIISDAKMPTGSGTDLLLMIRKELQFKGKILLVTGNLQDANRDREVGYDQVIYKPIQFQDLIAIVKKLIM